MTTPPPGNESSDTPTLRTRLGWALSWLALTLYFFAPVREVMDVHLDPSNFASYAYFTTHGFQYGPEVIPMAGPLGFVMYGFVYSGELFWARVLGQFVIMGGFAALVLRFFALHRDSPWRWAWLAGHLLLTAFNDDLPYDWSILLAGLLLLRVPCKIETVLWAALLGVLSLVKGTQLILAIATLAVVAATLLWQREPRRIAIIAIAYVATFAAGWLITGQHLAHIPAFVEGIRQLARGYNEAMARPEETVVIARGILVSALLALGFGFGAWRFRREPARLAAIALVVGISFAHWKHGFVRAGGHTLFFFHHAALAALTLPLLLRPILLARTSRIAIGALAVVTVVASLHLWAASHYRQIWELPQKAFERAIAQPVHLARLPAERAQWERELDAVRDFRALPRIREIVGDAHIDLFGLEHGVIPLNGLNYHPRPMGGGSFNVFNSWLMRRNRDFLRDPARRPEFYLMKFEAIDERFAALDDSLALQELLHGYEPFFVEQGYLLLRVREPFASAPAPRALSRVSFRFGETLHLPEVAQHEMLLARFDLPFSFRGKLRGALFQAPFIYATLSGDGIDEPTDRRIIPAMATEPLILSPVLETTDDVLALFTDETGKRLTHLRLDSPTPYGFADPLAVEFFAAPRPPPLVPAVEAALLPILHRAMGTVEFTAADETTARVLTHLLHAPGEFLWNLDGTERRFSFGYGLEPKSYEENDTDGVIFIVDVISPRGSVTEVFRRHLAPGQREADRGHHTAQLSLPPFSPGSRLRLRTDPGPHQNTGWDWSYVSGLRFTRGPFQPEQFPGFSPLPTQVDGDSISAVPHRDHHVVLLHAPGALIFPLDGTERSATLDFGFLPGSYHDGGQTDGADFVIELQAGEQPPREIFRRALRPVSTAADRGQHHAVVPLPALNAGDRLVLRTTVGPGTDNSWDWTYIAHFDLR